MDNETLFRAGQNCAAVARAARAAFLVDGEAYFDALARSAERAERSIMILGWDFDSRMALRFDANAQPLERLGDFLNRLAHANHRLRIRVLDWDYPMIFGHDREFPPIYGLAWKPHPRIDFRYDDTHPLAGSHHQKVVVIDDKVAFVGGLDLTAKRWDSPRHAPGDPRRTFNDAPYPPMHDVMAAVDADAARALARIAHERWRAATGEAIAWVETAGDPWPADLAVDMQDVMAAVACTAPPCAGGEGVHHVEKLYLDMIARARDYIYIENQYFTSHAIAAALSARLQEESGPEIVLATRLLSHGWLEEVTMQVLRTRLVRELREADRHGRFHAYCPRVDGLTEGTCIDLHSKVMVVDDAWLRIGSSNLSNRSMGMDSECDIVFEARGDATLASTIRTFRDRLLGEHLGTDAEAVAAAVERSGTLSAAIDALATRPRRLEKLDAPELSATQLDLASVADLERPLALEAMVQQFAPDITPEAPPGRRAIALICLVVVVLALAWRYTPLAEYVTTDNAVGWIRAFSGHWWAPLAVIASYTLASVLMFPRWLITMAAVIAFGPWQGFAYGMTGMVVAAIASYLPGRLVARDTVRRLAGQRLNRLSAMLHRRGMLAVTVVRLVPIAPFVVVNLVMGAMRIRFGDFLLGSLIGLLPGMLIATVLSEQISAALDDPASVNLWMAGAAACILAALAYGGHRWLRGADTKPGRAFT